jgi:hypothetical protein
MGMIWSGAQQPVLLFVQCSTASLQFNFGTCYSTICLCQFKICCSGIALLLIPCRLCVASMVINGFSYFTAQGGCLVCKLSKVKIAILRTTTRCSCYNRWRNYGCSSRSVSWPSRCLLPFGSWSRKGNAHFFCRFVYASYMFSTIIRLMNFWSSAVFVYCFHAVNKPRTRSSFKIWCEVEFLSWVELWNIFLTSYIKSGGSAWVQPTARDFGVLTEIIQCGKIILFRF